MSRNGTLEDALKSISDFNKHHQEHRKAREQRGQSLKGKSKHHNGCDPDVSKASVSSADEELKQSNRKRFRDEKKRRSKEKTKRRDESEASSSEEERHRKKRSGKKSSNKGGRPGEEVSDDDRRDRKEVSDDDRKERRERRKRRNEKERERRRRRKRRRDVSSTGSESDESSDKKAANSERKVATADAIRAAEDVLTAYAELRSELVQLLSTLDAGQAVDISSIPDAQLKSLLSDLFLALGLQRSPLGLYLLPEGSPKTLQTLAPVLSLEQNGASHTSGGDAIASGPAAPSPPPSAAELENPPEQQAGSTDAPVIGPAFPPTASAQVEGRGIGPSEVAGAVRPVIGPALPGGKAELVEEEVLEVVEIGPAAGPPPAQKKRVIGPAAPPPEVLDAAAKLSEAQEELSAADEEDDVLIGPPPPALVAEADSAPERERFDEVTHILAPTTKDPYTLLRVKPDVSASEIKKRYWKLSLLVHPDKCAHPKAQHAFTVLNKAFKEVEDPAKRAIVDAKLAEIQRKAEFAEEMKALREAAEWRKLRGQAEPGDDELLGAAPEEEARDTWMTELPPERQAGSAMPMQSTYFSAKEQTGRGDTSAWTDTPQEKAKRAQQQYLEAYSQAMLGPSAEEAQAAEKASATAQIIDSYNSKKRAQSLVEKHQEAMLKAKQSKKKKKKEESTKTEEWEGSHPWKPWDREKDLVVGKTVKLDRDSSATALASRFGAGRPEERRFL